MCQFARYTEIRNKYGVDPRDKSKNKEHSGENGY